MTLTTQLCLYRQSEAPPFSAVVLVVLTVLLVLILVLLILVLLILTVLTGAVLIRHIRVLLK